MCNNIQKAAKVSYDIMAFLLAINRKPSINGPQASSDSEEMLTFSCHGIASCKEREAPEIGTKRETGERQRPAPVTNIIKEVIAPAHQITNSTTYQE